MREHLYYPQTNLTLPIAVRLTPEGGRAVMNIYAFLELD